MSLEVTGEGRTGLLRSRYAASKHLDAAVTVLGSIEAVGHAMVAPAVEAIEVRQFVFVEHVIDKTAALPENIRFDPPRTLEDCRFWTADLPTVDTR